MDLTESLDASCPPEQLFALIEDLGRYPEWLGIVPVAEPEAPRSGTPTARVPDGGSPETGAAAAAELGGGGGEPDGPAWSVELQGRIGPLARSKRLRMVRTRRDVPRSVRFERRELDGRRHSPWILDAVVDEVPTGSRLTMRLRYDGGFGTSVLEGLLRDEIDRSRPRLRALAEHAAPST